MVCSLSVGCLGWASHVSGTGQRARLASRHSAVLWSESLPLRGITGRMATAHPVCPSTLRGPWAPLGTWGWCWVDRLQGCVRLRTPCSAPGCTPAWNGRVTDEPVDLPGEVGRAPWHRNAEPFTKEAARVTRAMSYTDLKEDTGAGTGAGSRPVLPLGLEPTLHPVGGFSPVGLSWEGAGGRGGVAGRPCTRPTVTAPSTT